MTGDLDVRRDGDVTRLVLARAEKANALSERMVDALAAAVEAAAGDGTRLLVLQGEGRHFCAGFDFGGLEEQSDGDLALRFVRVELLLQALWHSPVPTLALAHGRVFGAGADLFACCDRRIAAPGTRFLMPGPRFGVVLGTRRLAERIGADRARAIQTAPREIDADEAVAVGLASEIADPEAWEARVEAASQGAASLDAATVTSLLRATREDRRDHDLSTLVRSVAVPGLADRIRSFRGG